MLFVSNQLIEWQITAQYRVYIIFGHIHMIILVVVRFFRSSSSSHFLSYSVFGHVQIFWSNSFCQIESVKWITLHNKSLKHNHGEFLVHKLQIYFLHFFGKRVVKIAKPHKNLFFALVHKIISVGVQGYWRN